MRHPGKSKSRQRKGPGSPVAHAVDVPSTSPLPLEMPATGGPSPAAVLGRARLGEVGERPCGGGGRGWEGPTVSTPRGPVEQLQALARARQALEVRQAAAVARARDEGRSWAEIGRALGVTAQAAHKRYAS